MNVFLKRALIAAPISLIWVLFFTPLNAASIFSLFGSWVGAFLLVYIILTVIGLFTRPKKPVAEEPVVQSEDDLFE